MSRPIGAVEEYPLSTFIDREALMMDGGRLYFQLSPEDTAGDDLTLARFEGTRVTDANDPTFTGILRRTSGGGWVIDAGGVPRRKLRLSRGMALITAAGRFLSLGAAFAIVEDRQLSQGELSAFFNPGGTGTSYAPLSYSSSQAAQTQAETFERAQAARDAQIAAGAATLLSQRRAEQDRLDRQADINAALVREEGAAQRSRLSSLTQLIGDYLDQQSQARDTLANLQPDPFRHAAVAGGIAPFGVTPQQGFQKQLRQFAGAAVPSFDPSGSAASLQPIIDQLTGVQAPTAPAMFGTPTVGMARGGTVPIPFDVMNTIEMSKGADGSYSAVPLPFDVSARLVGENPDGTVNKTTEVMIVTPQGTTVLPLSSGMARGGIADFNFQEIPFDKETLLPPLGTSGIFGSLGLDTIPKRTMFGQTGETITGGFGDLSRLGIAPRFVRDIFTGEIWRIEGNTRHRVTDPALMAGLPPADVVGAQTSEIQRLAPNVGGELTTALQVNPPVPTTQPSAFTRRPVPIIEPATGTLLPAPFTVAEQMNRLAITDPGAFNLLLSAYKAAGEPVQDVLSTIQSSLVFGQARSAVGLR